MNNQTKKQAAFKQISLPVDFLSEVIASAALSDRSPAKELEHCFRIVQALEHLLPSKSLNALKTDQLGVRELLVRLVTLLDSQSDVNSLETVKSKNPVRYSVHPENPQQFIRHNADGTTDTGLFEDIQTKFEST